MRQALTDENPLKQGDREVLMQLAEHAGMGLYILTFRAEQPVCEFANRAWKGWRGDCVSAKAIDGRDWMTFFHPDDRLRMQQLYLRVLLTGRAETTEYRLCRSQNDSLWIADSICPLLDESGQTLGVGGCAQDISLLKSAREEMQRTQLLQSIGSLMAGIAHEMNSPLQFIGDNLHFMSDAWESVSRYLAFLSEGLDRICQNPDPACIRSVSDSAVRLRNESNIEFMKREFPVAAGQSLEGIMCLMRLVSAMRDFSHLEERRQAPADLNRAITSALTLLQNQLKYVCDVQTQYDEELPQVNCSIDEINRVILNLLINAGHSIAEKIEKGHFERGLIRVGTERLPNGIRIFIEDNGMGIAPEVQPHIFERFFTTKRHHPERKGTGQGLSMAYEAIIEHHRGNLTFRTHPGQGTVFEVFLPSEQSRKGGM